WDRRRGGDGAPAPAVPRRVPPPAVPGHGGRLLRVAARRTDAPALLRAAALTASHGSRGPVGAMAASRGSAVAHRPGDHVPCVRPAGFRPRSHAGHPRPRGSRALARPLGGRSRRPASAARTVPDEALEIYPVSSLVNSP